MALASGKCPKCGEIIKVNAEKKSGFCSKCGQPIDVQPSLSLFAQAQEPAQAQPVRKAPTQSARAAAPLNADAKIKEMFEFCGSESDFLMLRSKVMEMSVSDTDKAKLLEALDQATKKRLAEAFEKAEKYKSATESPMSTIIGGICLAAIGLAVNYFFHMKWPGIAGVALGIIGIIGTFMDRFNKKEMQANKAAADLIALYRSRGYKI